MEASPPAEDELRQYEWDPSVLRKDIEILREKYENQPCGAESPGLQFDFACHLICSSNRTEVREGVTLLEELLHVGFERAEVLHFLVLSYLKIGRYSDAKEKAELWLCIEPTNGMARLLHSVVLERASHDGLLGLFFFGVAGVTTALLAMRHWR
eukprot:TRINITY_DN14808_c0_g1_i1.p1 TRINITY_DN14808_c0_g1~~TRINITY_DN14808_c0_g1_i1.p1  ORF type:complete len:154 (+),score=38.54 TRINITY_DN14808_c0_g1_i1:68-529(+)